MILILLLLLIGTPLLEIAVFIEVGGLIGLGPTLALVILTAVVGTWQLRTQGLATLARARAQLDKGELPTRELFDGACVLVSGVLLLTPGFVTDLLGLLLFLPPIRSALRVWLGRRLTQRMETAIWLHKQEPHLRGSKGRVVEGEYRDISEQPAEAPEAEASEAARRRRLGR
jgi:UPF0716 protein FxsA